jgi:MFS family permease
MFLNLSLSPLGIILPVLAKESRGMPAWFLGALESSISLGAILGAICLGYVQQKIRGVWLMVVSISMVGVGVALLPWVPNALLPVSVLFFVGLAISWANIPLGTQISLSVPNSHRGRVGSIMGFLCNGISPLGVAVAGLVMGMIGLKSFLVGMGIMVVALTPLILLIPHIRQFFLAKPAEAEGFFDTYYPGAFRD